jgi:hypothetical protein
MDFAGICLKAKYHPLTIVNIALFAKGGSEDADRFYIRDFFAFCKEEMKKGRRGVPPRCSARQK